MKARTIPRSRFTGAPRHVIELSQQELEALQELVLHGVEDCRDFAKRTATPHYVGTLTRVSRTVQELGV